MTLQTVQDALLTVGLPTYHLHTDGGATGNYIMWAEEGATASLYADNTVQAQALTGTVNYFTKTEYDQAFTWIQQALSSANIPYRLVSIQREADTGYIHYKWSWELEI